MTATNGTSEFNGAPLAPPQNLEAEQSVLGAVLMSESVLPALIIDERLTAKDFYKTMESTHKPGLYQDVYRPTVRTPLHPKGIQVYCKVQLVSAGWLLVVISCKAR